MIVCNILASLGSSYADTLVVFVPHVFIHRTNVHAQLTMNGRNDNTRVFAERLRLGLCFYASVISGARFTTHFPLRYFTIASLETLPGPNSRCIRHGNHVLNYREKNVSNRRGK